MSFLERVTALRDFLQHSDSSAQSKGVIIADPNRFKPHLETANELVSALTTLAMTEPHPRITQPQYEPTEDPHRKRLRIEGAGTSRSTRTQPNLSNQSPPPRNSDLDYQE